MNIFVTCIKFSLACLALSLLAACNGGGGDSKPKTTSSAASNNSRPIAIAGPDQTVTEGQLVTLNGQNSYDPEGSTLIFQWRQIGGPAINLTSESDDTPSFIAPNGNQIITFQLVTDDGENLSIADTITITVASSNTTETDNKTDNSDSNSGSGSSSDGDSAADNETTDNTSDSSNSDENSDNTDNTDNTDSESTQDNGSTQDDANSEDNQSTSEENNETDTAIENTAPTANAGQDRTLQGFSLVVLDGSSSADPENDVLSYSWQQTSGTTVTINNPNLASANFDAPNVSDTLVFELTVNDAEFTSIADQVSITIEQVNTAPIANAGTDITIQGLSSVTLNGNTSSDPEGDSLSYQWQQTSGPSITLDDFSSSNPSFEAPNIDASISFSLVVNDGEFNSSPDNIVVNIQSVNTAPIADAGNNQSIQGLTEVFLDGTFSSDPENDQLNFTWSQISGDSISLTNPNTSTPSFIAPNIADTLTFTLIVSDGNLNSIADQVSVSIEPINTIPVAHAGVDRYVGSLSVVALNGSLSEDADNDSITYSWTQVSGPSVSLSDATAVKPIFTADTDGQLIFSLTVNDGQNDSEPDTVRVIVGPIPATNIKVNGTGITWGGSYPTGNNAGCIGQAIDQQDCSLGRELTHNDDSDGRVGFSFTKFDSNGVEVDASDSEWQCVQDSVTGLMWEIKTGGNGVIGDEGINDADDRFSWYNSDPASNGGGDGFMDNQGEVCSDYDNEDPQTHCNTQAFVNRMNKNAWCGFADWRLPTRKELLSIIDYGNSRPMIDSDYFPEVGQYVWTSTPLALGSTSAWGVNFDYGNSFSIDKRNARQVRLVRGGYE